MKIEELKEKARSCNLAQFKNYNEYIIYVQKLALEYMKENNLTIEELNELLEEVK